MSRLELIQRKTENSWLEMSQAFTKIYQDYLGEPLSELSEILLHTDHTAWEMH